MSDEQWLTFFRVCASVLGQGSAPVEQSASWCAWTTFNSLKESVQYWSAGLPQEAELGPHGTTDGGTWGQPFSYQSLAHVIIPKEFYWESAAAPGFRHGTKRQDIEWLSRELTNVGVQHRLTELVLEIKCY